MAGAVLFGLVACALPLRPGGCPIITLANKPKILRLRTLELGEDGGSDSEESQHHQDVLTRCVDSEAETETDACSWEVPSSPNRRNPDDATEEDMGPQGGILVFLVDLDEPEEKLKTCVSCRDLIQPGTVLISWQSKEDSPVYHMHSACCSNFAVSKGIATEVLAALVENQPFVRERLHGIVNLVVHELLFMTRDAQKKSKNTSSAAAVGDDDAGLPPTVPASPSALPTIPALLEEPTHFEESQAFESSQ